MPPLSPMNQNVDDSTFVFLIVEKDETKPCRDLAWTLTWATEPKSPDRYVIEFSDAGKVPGVQLSIASDDLLPWLLRNTGWMAELPDGYARAWRLGNFKHSQSELFITLALQTKVPESMQDEVIRARHFLPLVMWNATSLRTRSKGVPALLSVDLVDAALREAIEMNI